MIPYSRPKLSDLYTLSQSKLFEYHYVHSGTYLYSPYEQYPPGFNPLARITLALTLRKEKVASVTAMIFFHIILHPAVLIYDFHIFITSSSSFHGFNTNQFNDLFPVGLLANLSVILSSLSLPHRFMLSRVINFYFMIPRSQWL